jgi:hypothetical protein
MACQTGQKTPVFTTPNILPADETLTWSLPFSAWSSRVPLINRHEKYAYNSGVLGDMTRALCSSTHILVLCSVVYDYSLLSEQRIHQGMQVDSHHSLGANTLLSKNSLIVHEFEEVK